MGLGRWRPSSRQTHRLPCDDCAIAIGRWMPFGLFRSALVGCQPPAWRGRVKGRCSGYALVPNRGRDNQSRPNPDLALNNPAAGCMPTAGPSCGGLSTGRSLHAIPGVKLPLAVILTAHRLRSPCARPGRRPRALVIKCSALCRWGVTRIGLKRCSWRPHNERPPVGRRVRQ